jgi:hypothetical protein
VVADPVDVALCDTNDLQVLLTAVAALDERRRIDGITTTHDFYVPQAAFDSRTPVPGKEHSGHWMKTIEDVVDHHAVVQLGINAPISSDAS